ncbi:hypothetical protein [Hydrogenophaga palleronii]|nr:hypothetical protein [Hydrogenophaga palleronii]
MGIEQDLSAQWPGVRDRLQVKGLLDGEGASLSLRIPGTEAMWFGLASDSAPQRLVWRAAPREAEAHGATYITRSDVGAIAVGGGAFGRCLADFGGAMPQVFDEQARHLGPMGPPSAGVGDVPAVLRQGGNALLLRGRPVCLGMTALRLALNAELFEKCAKAYVLAVAGNGRVRPLPWIVRLVANRRLAKDRQRAAVRFVQGLLPEESNGY